MGFNALSGAQIAQRNGREKTVGGRRNERPREEQATFNDGGERESEA
jgi:hypothetical protein